MALSRSQNMARIRSVDTEPELIVRRALYREGLRYRLQMKTPGGRADLVIPAQKFALFIDGCFWHGCPEHYVHPRSNWPFWDGKLRENLERDRRQTQALVAEGWRYLRVWEHEVREDPLAVLKAIRERLQAAPQAVGGWRVVFVRPVQDGGDSEERLHEDLLERDRQLRTVRVRTTAKTGRVARGEVRHLSVPATKKRRPTRHHARRHSDATD